MLNRILAFLKFYAKAKVVYDLHSPTAYNFAARVLEDRRRYYRFDEVENLRKNLINSTEHIPAIDFGAGSKKKQKTVGHIARHSACSAALGRMLFKTALLKQPQTILELGTSLGISALYLTGGAMQAKFYGIEGNPHICRKAKENLQLLNNNSTILCGTFRQMLPIALQELKQVDLVFFDGDHRREATLELFEKVLPHASEQAIFIFDDIHWSKDMSLAWEEIQRHPQVRLSIDIWRAGFVFLGSHLKVKQHFNLVPRHWKPWRLGFFQ